MDFVSFFWAEASSRFWTSSELVRRRKWLCMKKNFDTKSVEIQQVQLYVKAELFLKNELDLQTLGVKMFFFLHTDYFQLHPTTLDG